MGYTSKLGAYLANTLLGETNFHTQIEGLLVMNISGYSEKGLRRKVFFVQVLFRKKIASTDCAFSDCSPEGSVTYNLNKSKNNWVLNSPHNESTYLPYPHVSNWSRLLIVREGIKLLWLNC
ncbi:hypothetical protein L2E82_01938 [Cichorium intybus]|uniref:Uncharacterized protein n=1 Tax=Cichorium intybus TaxID=13427 RepID=A0ACB9H097_CICIN|nr:hypothetical protein L2E82_01938 [Cichorium intybus]